MFRWKTKRLVFAIYGLFTFSIFVQFGMLYRVPPCESQYTPYHMRPNQSLAPRRVLLQPFKDYTGLKYILSVNTRIEDTNIRNEWRRNYGQFSKKFNYSLLFPLGTSCHTDELDVVLHEAEEYGDILMSDFTDSYYNLPIKQLSVMRYFQKLNTPLLMKIDDDMVLDVEKLSEVINMIPRTDENLYSDAFGDRIWGNIAFNAEVSRNVSDKWYVPVDRFRANNYPDFCNGIAYIMSNTAVTEILLETDNTAWLWLEDVLITGIMADKSSVNRVNWSHLFNFKDVEESVKKRIGLLHLATKELTDKYFRIVNRKLLR